MDTLMWVSGNGATKVSDNVHRMSPAGQTPPTLSNANGNGGGSWSEVLQRLAAIETELKHIPTEKDLNEALKEVIKENDKKWHQYVTWFLIVFVPTILLFIRNAFL